MYGTHTVSSKINSSYNQIVLQGNHQLEQQSLTLILALTPATMPDTGPSPNANSDWSHVKEYGNELRCLNSAKGSKNLTPNVEFKMTTYGGFQVTFNC